MHVWKQKREKRLFAAASYQTHRQPRRCKQAQQQPLGLSSGNSSHHSTVPDSQATTGSRHTFPSQPTQLSNSEAQSQGSSLSGSLFCPDSPSLSSQLSGNPRTQVLQQGSQSSNSGRRPTFHAEAYPSSLNSLSGDFSATSNVLSSIPHSSSQDQPTVSQEIVSQQISSSLPDSANPNALGHHATPPGRHQCSERSILGTKKFTSHRQPDILEIEETPPSRLLTSQSTSGKRSDGKTTNSKTRSASAYGGKSSHLATFPCGYGMLCAANDQFSHRNAISSATTSINNRNDTRDSLL